MSLAILIVEDEAALARNFAGFLKDCGHDVRTAGSAEDALRELESYRPDVVLLDFNLPGLDGLKAIDRILAVDAAVRIIMVTGHASVELAVDAMKAGAYDFITKPVSLSKLRLVLEKLRTEKRQKDALAYYRSRDARASGLDKLVGECDAMRKLRDSIRRVVAGDGRLRDGQPPSVLITGETGTGKELVARALHFEGPRRDEAFVEINCAAIPAQLLESELFGHERGAFTDAKARKPGLIETADRGTLLLDEIGDMDLALQTKLLRLLEDRSVRRVGGLRDQAVDVRIITATHRPLEALIADGRFRDDLYYRIRTVQLSVPPLRERGNDILLLADHFLSVHARRYDCGAMQLSERARDALLRHSWPGNVRELRNVMERAVLMSPGTLLEPGDFDWSASPSASTAEVQLRAPSEELNLDVIERDALRKALESTRGNVSQAARLLGISRDTMRYRIEKHALTVREST